MVGRIAWVWRQVTASLWYRVSLYALAAVLTALVAHWATPLVPAALTAALKEWAAQEILSILASSMLLIATFSLGSLVAAYAAAASIATPRATRVLIEDPLSQNVLSTFLGAFVFALVGLIALALGYYSPQGEAVLIVAAAVIVAIVIGTLIAWLDHLANLVRLGDIVRKLEARAAAALGRRAAAPFLGAAAAHGRSEGVPVAAAETGYVRHLDVGALQRLAERAEGSVAVELLPGQLADPARALARTSWVPSEEDAAAVRAAFALGPERSFEQDPRYGIVVIAEIASRALSPGVNDPGTAIGVIATLQRLLAGWTPATAPEVACPRVLVPAIATHDLYEDAFGPLARDAAGLVEVGLRLQKALAALAARSPSEAAAARALAAHARAHAEQALALDADRARIAAAAARVGSAA